jgi:hypothetical protein
MNPIKTKAYKLFRKGNNGALLPFLVTLKYLGLEYKPDRLNKSPYGPIFIFKDLETLKEFVSCLNLNDYEVWEVEGYGVKEAPNSIARLENSVDTAYELSRFILNFWANLTSAYVRLTPSGTLLCKSMRLKRKLDKSEYAEYASD